MSEPNLSRRELFATSAIAATGALGAPSEAQARNPRAPINILAEGLDEKYASQIRNISRQITLVQNVNGDRNAALNRADAMWGGLTPEEQRIATRLRWLQYPAAGVESILTPTFVQSDIILTNAKGCYAPEIAEHAFGLLFSLSRNIAMHVRLMREHKWQQGARPTELRGLTMGIVGLGGIGREVARRAKVMDMHVIAVDAEPMYGEHFHMVDDISLVDVGLKNLMSTADVVISCAPITKRTEGMFGAEQFGWMKPTAWFINVSRGRLVQTPALVAALKSGKIAGAGLDVTSPEPLPTNHALWDMPNVVVTPHIAGQSQLAVERTQQVFVENVKRYVSGQPLLNIVDKNKGY
ncbi:MAG: D-2-hydroxyacid dehydrogenase [Chthonomonadales bacterium]